MPKWKSGQGRASSSKRRCFPWRRTASTRRPTRALRHRAGGDPLEHDRIARARDPRDPAAPAPPPRRGADRARPPGSSGIAVSSPRAYGLRGGRTSDPALRIRPPALRTGPHLLEASTARVRPGPVSTGTSPPDVWNRTPDCALPNDRVRRWRDSDAQGPLGATLQLAESLLSCPLDPHFSEATLMSSGLLAPSWRPVPRPPRRPRPAGLRRGSGGGSRTGRGGPRARPRQLLPGESGQRARSTGCCSFEFSEPVDPTHHQPGHRPDPQGESYGLTATGEFVVDGATVYFKPRLPTTCDDSRCGLPAGHHLSRDGHGLSRGVQRPEQQGTAPRRRRSPTSSPRVRTRTRRYLEDQIPATPPAVTTARPRTPRRPSPVADSATRS